MVTCGRWRQICRGGAALAPRAACASAPLSEQPSRVGHVHRRAGLVSRHSTAGPPPSRNRQTNCLGQVRYGHALCRQQQSALLCRTRRTPPLPLVFFYIDRRAASARRHCRYRRGRETRWHVQCWALRAPARSAVSRTGWWRSTQVPILLRAGMASLSGTWRAGSRAQATSHISPTLAKSRRARARAACLRLSCSDMHMWL